MLQFTCGSTQPIDLSKFDGVVIGYHWRLFEPGGICNPLNFPDKIIRAQFLYGNKHHKPETTSNCETIEQWVGQRVRRFPQISEWVLVNEFTDDLGVPYSQYKLDDLKRYCEAAHTANPNARLIIGDFKPHLLRKWEAIARICHALRDCGFPVEIGIQTHLKTYNTPVALARLPKIISSFEIPVHFIEASLWHQGLDQGLCKGFWGGLEAIAHRHDIKSFCRWWLTPEDTDVGRRMPTFEKLNLYLPMRYHQGRTSDCKIAIAF